MDPLLAEGKLPTFQRLIKKGTRAILRSTILPISPAAWSSFATGKKADKHGIFDFAHRKAGSYDPIPYNSRDRKSEAIWNILSRRKKKVIVLNVPLTYPVEKVNGLMISGFPTPEELGDFTYPKKLIDELRKEFGKDFRFQSRVSAQNEEPFLEEMQTITEYVFQATEYLMNNYSWDFLTTVFVGPDALSHVFYKYMDPDHPFYEPKAPKRYKSAVADMYMDIDRKISALIKNIDSDTTLFFMSDHGFGPMYYSVSINNWLKQERFLALKRSIPTRIRYWLFKRGANYSNLIKMVRALKMTKHAMKAAYKPKSTLASLSRRFFLSNDDIDWMQTTAYSMGNIGQIFVNLKGREPIGIVEPGKEYDMVVEQLRSRLGKLKDPKKDITVFNEIYLKKEVFPSSTKGDNTPDVIFYDREMKYSINRFFGFGSKELITPHPIWSGTHTHDGIFLGYNEDNILKGKSIDNASICDIAPTVLHIMGSSVPNDMDGRVLSVLFKRNSEIKGRKVRYTDLEKERIMRSINVLKGRDTI